MSLNDSLAIVVAAAQILEALVVAATLIYVIRQTNLTRISVKDVERQTRVGISTTLNFHIAELGDTLLQDEELAKLLGWSKANLMAFSFLNNLEMRFIAHKEGATDDMTWQADRTLITDLLQREFIVQTWQRYKGEYHPDFVRFADKIIEEAQSNTTN